MRRQDLTSRVARGSAPRQRTPASLEAVGIQVRQYRFTAGRALAQHAHAYPAVFAVVAGKLAGTVRSTDYSCESGDVVIIPADLRHSERIGPLGVRSLAMTPSPDQAPAGPFAEPSIVVRRHPEIRRLVWRLEHAWGTRDEDGASLAFECGIQELLNALQDGTEEANLLRGAIPRGVRRARELLHDSLGSRLSLDEVAEYTDLSRAQLTRTFRRAMGCSIGTYVERLRLDRAAAALRDTDRPIADIAAAAGYCDQSHFTTAFRRMMGRPPGSFRKRQRAPGDAGGSP